MKLVDANVLLYAVNSASVHHRRSKAWLDQALTGHETIGFSWPALVAFLRLSTHAAMPSARPVSTKLVARPPRPMSHLP
jgi:predicted nucleic acid-binding protein